jgi:hypothetical protein
MLISCSYVIFLFICLPIVVKTGNAHANPNKYRDAFEWVLLRRAFHIIQEFENKVG